MASIPPQGWPPWVQEWVVPYLEEHALWPVLFAVLGHVLVILVPLMTWAQRSQNPVAYLFLGCILAACGGLARMEWLAIGRLGRLTLVLFLTWAASLPVAWYTGSLGIF